MAASPSEEYIEIYNPDRFLAFYHSMAGELRLLDNPRRPIPVSPVPLFLESHFQESFSELGELLWRILTNPAYRDLCTARIPSFMVDPSLKRPAAGAIPFDPKCNIGCLDLHLRDGRPGLIEFMVLPPGMSGIYPGLLERYQGYLETLMPGVHLKSFSEGWDRARCENEMVAGVVGNGPVERVAVVDWEPDTQITFGEFRYLLELVRKKRGVDGLVADPREVSRRGGQVLVKGLPVDRIVNRVTFPDWQNHGREFRSYTCLLWELPEIFAYHPYQWFLGDKYSLVLLSDPGAMERLLPEPAARELLAAAIPLTLPLASFRTPGGRAIDAAKLIDRFGGSPAGLVLKPVSSHASKGVYFGPLDIPTHDKLDAVLQGIDADTYVAMELVPPPEVDVPRGGRVRERWKCDIRIYMLNSACVFPGGRAYVGEYTNQTPCRGFAPLYYL